MKLCKQKLQAWIWGIGLSLFLYSDGLIKWLAWRQMESGRLNPLWSAAIVAVALGGYLRYKRRSMVSVWIPVCTVLTVMILFYGWESGLFEKCIRDVIYLWLIVITWQAMQAVHQSRAIDIHLFAKVLFTISLVIVPLSTYFGLHNYYDLYDEGRFASFMLTPTMFSINLFLLFWFADMVIDDLRLTIFGTCIALFFIALSGTRVVFLLMIAYMACRVLLGIAQGRHSTVLRLLVLAVCMATILVPLAVFIAGVDGLPFEHLRILELGDDKEYGSVYSRTHYYTVVWKHIVGNGGWGGFGSGTAEQLTSVLTHFDFLRFWHDYSVIYPIALLSMLRALTFAFRKKSGMPQMLSYRHAALSLYALFILGVTILLSTHNIFQIPSSLMLMTMALFYSHYFMVKPIARAYQKPVIQPLAVNASLATTVPPRKACLMPDRHAKENTYSRSCLVLLRSRNIVDQ